MMKQTKTANVTPTDLEVANVLWLRNHVTRLDDEVEALSQQLDALIELRTAAMDRWAQASYETYHARNINGPASFSFYERQ